SRSRPRGARRPSCGGAGGDRARVLGWTHVSRGGCDVGRTRGHGEEPHPLGPEAVARRAGRRRDRNGGVVVSDVDEFTELLGAYALDAVEPDEREAVERHLADCPRCRSEVAEHREVAAYLAHAGTDAPE